MDVGPERANGAKIRFGRDVVGDVELAGPPGVPSNTP
jgi:hypothetical protein